MAAPDGTVELLSEEAYNRVRQGTAELVEQLRLLKEINRTAGQSRTPGTSDAATQQLTQQLAAQEATIRRLQESYTQLAARQRQSNRAGIEENALRQATRRELGQQYRANTELLGSYSRLNAQVAIASRRLQDLIASGTASRRELRLAQREFDQLNTRVTAADRAVGRFNRNVGNYPKQALNSLSDLVTAFGLVGGVTAFAILAKDVFNTTRELQSLDLALSQVIGNQKEFERTQSFLSKIAEDYGIDINVLTKSFTGFFASAKNAMDDGKISATQIRNIFQSVSKAAGAMGLSVDQQQGAFLALSQMISKGTVQAEELRGQLSERLPGAFGILAKSMGVTEQQLNKMLKDGKVLAAEVLPAFARELERSYGVENLERVESLAASTTRLKNAWIELIRVVSEGEGVFSKSLTYITEGFSKTLQGIGYLLQGSAEKRGAQLKMIYQQGYDEQFKYYDKEKEFLDKSKKDQLDYTRSVLESASERAQQLKNEADVLNERNRFLEKNGSRNAFGALKNRSERFEVARNIAQIKLLNQQISLQNGIIDASSEYLKENTKAKVANNEEDKKKRTIKTDPFGAELNARLRYLKELRDANESEYQAEKEYQEFLAANQEEIAKNTKLGYDVRIEAYGKYLKIKQDLLAKDLARERLQAKEQETIDLAEAKKAEAADIKRATGGKSVANQTRDERRAVVKIRQYWADQIELIQQRHVDNLEKIDIKNSRETQKNAEETAKALILIEEEKQRIIASTNKQYRDEEIANFQATSQNEALMLDVRQAAFDASIALQRRQLDIDKQAALALTNGSKEQYDEVIAKFEILDRALTKESGNSPFAARIKEANDALREIAQTAKSGVFEGAGFSSLNQLFDFDANGQSSFDKIIEGFDKIEDRTESFQKKFATYFAAIGSIAQDTFAFIDNMNRQAYENQVQLLEKQYRIDLAFAGDNNDAKIELERQYDEKRKALAKERARQEREQALFNAAINIATGITAALAQGGPAGFALAAIVAALGAVQIALIASEPLPEYYKGREGGAAETAWVDERGPELHLDKNNRVKSWGKSGANKRFLEAGDTIKTAEETRSIRNQLTAFDSGLNSILDNRGISLHSAPVLIDYDAMGKAFIKGAQSMPKQDSVQFSLSENGLERFIIRDGIKKKIVNASLNNKPRYV